jgi:hypothetical protein
MPETIEENQRKLYKYTSIFDKLSYINKQINETNIYAKRITKLLNKLTNTINYYRKKEQIINNPIKKCGTIFIINYHNITLLITCAHVVDNSILNNSKIITRLSFDGLSGPINDTNSFNMHGDIAIFRTSYNKHGFSIGNDPNIGDTVWIATSNDINKYYPATVDRYEDTWDGFVITLHDKDISTNCWSGTPIMIYQFGNLIVCGMISIGDDSWFGCIPASSLREYIDVGLLNIN